MKTLFIFLALILSSQFVCASSLPVVHAENIQITQLKVIRGNTEKTYKIWANKNPKCPVARIEVVTVNGWMQLHITHANLRSCKNK